MSSSVECLPDYFCLPPDERLPAAAREDVERDRDEVDLAPLERAGDFFFVVERLVVVEPLERDPPEREPLDRELPDAALSFAGVAAGAGAGVAGGALAEATRVRPPATATRGSKPSSMSAIRAPMATAMAAARPRNTPIFNVG